MKYRKKPVVVDAQQWQPGKVIAGVREMVPEIVMSTNGQHFYLNALGGRLSDAWLPVSEGEVLPFAFYEVRSGQRFPASKGDSLTDKYLAHLGETELPLSYGIIKTLEGEMTVSPGDWVITGVKGEKYPCKPDIFEATYEAAS